MSIPEAQLSTWSNQGAIATSKLTHESIRNALAIYTKWPSNVTYDVYLQGSYRNDTNIRGDSDVDLVVELTSVFWNNLSDIEKARLGFTVSSYSLQEFKSSVIDALVTYYGHNLVDTSGSKSIKVLADNGRLKADVVVCGTYKYYENLRVRSEGITFWDSFNKQITNYPKLHVENGVEKNSNTNGWFKPVVRMYKNSRNKLINEGVIPEGTCPSYFIECLLYNVPDDYFGNTFQDSFLYISNYLNNSLNQSDTSQFVSQSGMHYLFGSSSVQWNTLDAKNLVSGLLTLWKDW